MEQQLLCLNVVLVVDFLYLHPLHIQVKQVLPLFPIIFVLYLNDLPSEPLASTLILSL